MDTHKSRFIDRCLRMSDLNDNWFEFMQRHGQGTFKILKHMGVHKSRLTNLSFSFCSCYLAFFNILKMLIPRQY